MNYAAAALFLPLFAHILNVWNWSFGMRSAFQKAPLDTRDTETNPPPIGVVLPVRNEAATLPKLMGDLAQQTHLPLQVIVIDDQSDDSTLAALEDAGPFPFQVTTMSNPGRGKKAGLSAGILQLNCDWAVGVDADTRLKPEALAAMARGIENQGEEKDMFLLPLRIALDASSAPDSLFHLLQGLDFAAMQGWAVSSVIKGQPAMASGGGWVWRTQAFPHDRLHPEIPSGDDVFALAALIQDEKGHRVGWINDPRAMVSAAPMLSFGALLDQRIRWGAKSTQYPRSLKAARRVALVVAAVHLCGLALMFIHIGYGLAFWLIKSIADVLYTRQMAKQYGLFEKRPHANGFALLMLALVHPFFIATTLLLMPFRKVRWKGRPAT